MRMEGKAGAMAKIPLCLTGLACPMDAVGGVRAALIVSCDGT